MRTKGTAPSYKRQSTEPDKEFLEACHSNLVGPLHSSVGGSKYFLTSMEAKFVLVYLLKGKDQVLKKFKASIAAVKNKFGKVSEVLFTDGGTEYSNREFKIFLQEQDIEHHTTITHQLKMKIWKI